MLEGVLGEACPAWESAQMGERPWGQGLKLWPWASFLRASLLVRDAPIFVLRSYCVYEVADDPQELTSPSEGGRCDDASARVLHLHGLESSCLGVVCLGKMQLSQVLRTD